MGDARQLLWLGELAEGNGPWYVHGAYHHHLSTNSFLPGNLLLKHMLLAIPQAIRTHNDFRRFNTRLRQSDPIELQAMEQELSEWVLDKKKTDPYRLPHASE